MSEEVSYKDFKKLDIRIGTIKTCEKVEGSDKLYRLKVDCGEPELRQILSSLVDYYVVEELVEGYPGYHESKASQDIWRNELWYAARR